MTPETTHPPCPKCGNRLQDPYIIPGTSKLHDAYCQACSRKFPGMNAAFEDGPLEKESSLDPEEALRLECNKYLDAFGFKVCNYEQGYRASGTTRVEKGTPDVYIQGHGIRAWIEYKIHPRKQTEHQEAFQEREEENGGLYYLVYTVEELLEAIENMQDHPDWRNQP